MKHCVKRSIRIQVTLSLIITGHMGCKIKGTYICYPGQLKHWILVRILQGSYIYNRLFLSIFINFDMGRLPFQVALKITKISTVSDVNSKFRQNRGSSS